MKEPEYKCDCGAPMNEGEAKTFTCCDACWDKAFPKKEANPEGENKPDTDSKDWKLLKWALGQIAQDKFPDKDERGCYELNPMVHQMAEWVWLHFMPQYQEINKMQSQQISALQQEIRTLRQQLEYYADKNQNQ